MKCKSFITILLSLFLIQPAFAQHIKTLQTLDQAPDFSLKGQDGKTYSLKDYKGKIVVLEWFNNDCPFVEKHYGTNNMQKLQEKYTGQGIVWFSVSSTKLSQALKAEDAQKIYNDRKAKATAILLDSDGDMARAYGAKTTPHMFIISAEGKIVYAGAIDDKPTFRKDMIDKSKNYVAAALDSLIKDPKKAIEIPATEAYGCSVKIDDKPSKVETKTETKTETKKK